jgi:hypothetical protein
MGATIMPVARAAAAYQFVILLIDRFMVYSSE